MRLRVTRNVGERNQISQKLKKHPVENWAPAASNRRASNEILGDGRIAEQETTRTRTKITQYTTHKNLKSAAFLAGFPIEHVHVALLSIPFRFDSVQFVSLLRLGTPNGSSHCLQESIRTLGSFGHIRLRDWSPGAAEKKSASRLYAK